VTSSLCAGLELSASVAHEAHALRNDNSCQITSFPKTFAVACTEPGSEICRCSNCGRLGKVRWCESSTSYRKNCFQFNNAKKCQATCALFSHHVCAYYCHLQVVSRIKALTASQTSDEDKLKVCATSGYNFFDYIGCCVTMYHSVAITIALVCNGRCLVSKSLMPNSTAGKISQQRCLSVNVYLCIMQLYGLYKQITVGDIIQ
jgi:hypothetical protein